MNIWPTINKNGAVLSGEWMNNMKSTTQKNNFKTWILIIGILLIGSNLRAPLTPVGSLIPFIRDDLAISNTLAGMITTLPLLAFALLSPFAPKIANKIGMEWTIFCALIVLMAGIFLRSSFGVASLFIGTGLIGLSIAIGNVLIPAYIKMSFPFKVGMMTGLYAVFMNLFASVASGVSVPISNLGDLGWEGALLFWVILTIIALIAWLPQLTKKKPKPLQVEKSSKSESNVWKSPLAWSITFFMGLQSFIFYTIVTWLPELLHHHGYSATSAGWMLFLLQFAIIPVTFIVPLLAEKMENQRILSILTALSFMSGITGLMIGHASLVVVSILLLGIASGSAFSLSMMFFSLRTTSGKQAAELSGMAQSFGYLLAALGPVLFGALFDMTGNWFFPLLMLIGVATLFCIAGFQSSKNRVLDDSVRENTLLYRKGV